MPITVRSFSKGGSSGNYSQTGVFSLQRPFNLEAGDVMLAAVAVSPRVFAQNQNEGRFYHPETPTGWRYLSSVTTADSELFVFMRVAEANEPDDYTFTITQKVNGVGIDSDPIKVLRGIIAYAGVDAQKTVNALRTSDFTGDALQVVTTRQDCRLVLFSLAVGEGADVNAQTFTEWIGVDNVSGAHLQVADTLQIPAGSSGVEAITSKGRVSRIMLALKPADARPEEPVEVAPPEQGSGAGLYEPEPTRTLGLRSFRIENGAFVEEAEPIRPVAIDVTYNGIGACTGGSMQFVQNPQWRPYSRVLELFYQPRIDGVLYPEVTYYACLVGVPEQDVNPEKIKQNVKGLFQIVAGQPISTDAYPQLPPVWNDAVILFAGTPVQVAPGSKDIWQTWTEFLGKLTADHPDCHYGVGRDRTFVQGRPQDGNFITIDALAPEVTNINPSQYVVNDYVTHFWLTPDADTDPVATFGVRSDLNTLVPRKTVTAQKDGSGTLELPAGLNAPVYEIGSYTLKVKGLLIPPALVTNLPGGVSQFVAGSRFVVAGGQAYSEIHTQALPRRNT
jgi:hypothetical protein